MPPDSGTTAVEIRSPKNTRPNQLNRRVDRAARELNLLNISSKGLRNIATMGQFITELGLVTYGNGRLLGSAQALQEGAAHCAELARKEGLPDDVRRAYLDLQLRFIKALDENVAMQLEVNKASPVGADGQTVSGAKPFLPGAQINPIQIVVSPGSTATITEKTAAKEEPCQK